MDVTGLRVAIDASAARQGAAQFNASLDSMAGRAHTVSQQIGEGFKPGEQAFRGFGATARTVSTQVAESLGTIRYGLRGMVDSVLNFRTLFDAAILGVSFNSIVGQISKLEDIKRSLTTVTGSVAQAGAAWRMLESDGEKFGLSVEDMAQKFARLSMATKGTALEGERTITIFRASEVAARAFGGGAEQADRTLQAFTNILSSANVQGDMMVRQLARFGGIPGAMEIAARAFFPLAKNSAEAINAMQEKLKSGTLSSEEFVAKFTQQMVKELGPAAEQAGNSISAWQARVSNAFDKLLADMGEGGLGSSIVKFLRELRDEINSPAFKEAASQLGGLLTSALRMLGNAIEFAGQHVGLLKTAFVGLVAFEVIDFVANLAKNVLILADAFALAATKAIAFATAKTAATAVSEVGAIGAVGAMFAKGGVMTAQGPVGASSSYGPAPLPGSMSRVPEGRVDTVRSYVLAEGYVSKPNIAFASGGIMTPFGPMPLRAYADGGVASMPQVALFGEGSKPEAFVPLEDGQNIPVSISASSAFVPLPDGRKIPATLNIKRYAAGGISTDDATPSLVEQIAKQQDSIDVLERAANVMPATQPTPEFKATRTFGPAQGGMPLSPAAATGQEMAKQTAPPPTLPSYQHRALTQAQPTIIQVNVPAPAPLRMAAAAPTPTIAAPAQPATPWNQQVSPPTQRLTERTSAPEARMSGGLMTALSAIAPAIVGAVVLLRQRLPTAPTSTVTTMRSAYRSEPQDDLLHRVAPPLIETRAVPGIEESAKNAAAGFDALAKAAKPAENSLLSFSEASRAVPPISPGIASLMSSGRGSLAYSARTAQVAGAARPVAGVGEQMGLFGGQAALGELSAINLKAESSVTRQVPDAIGLFEAMGKRAGAIASSIGDAFSTAGRTVSSGLRAGLDAVTGLLESMPRKFQAVEDALVGFFGTTLPSKIGAAKTAVTDFLALGAGGMWKKLDVGLANVAGQGAMQRLAGTGETALVDTGESALASAAKTAAVGTAGVAAGELTGGLTGATGAAGGLSSALAMFANPIGIAVLAVGALGLALYAVRDKQVLINGEAFKMGDIYAGMWINMKANAAAFWDWLKGAASTVMRGLGGLATTFIDTLAGAGATKQITSFLDKAWEGFKGFFHDVAEQGKRSREELEQLAKDAEIVSRTFGDQRLMPKYGAEELGKSMSADAVKKFLALQDQIPKEFFGKAQRDVPTIQQIPDAIDRFTRKPVTIPIDVAPSREMRQHVQDIEAQLEAMLSGGKENKMPFRQPEPPWKQAINELQSKAALAAPTAAAALYGQDEVERLRQVVEAEKMIAELGDKGPPKERIRGYFDEIARGNILLKANTEIEKERAKILAEPMMGRTPTFEFVDRSTFGGVNPERDLALAQENIKKLKLPAPEYAKAMDEATAAFERFMAAHVKVVELKPLGFEDVTRAIQHGTFAYEEYMHLEQQQLSNWERLKDASVDMVAQWNREAEATYLRTAAMKEYAAISAETEKAQFEIPRMRQLQTAQLQGGEAARGVQAQQAQETQLFQITGARNWNEFKQQYGAALSAPETLPTPVQSYAQNLGLIGGKPQQAKMLGVDIGTEQNPLFVTIAKVGAKKVGVPVHDAGQSDMFSLGNIVGPEVSGILGLGQPQVTVPLRPQGVQTTTAPFNPAQNMANIDDAAAKDLAARMDLARQQSIDKTVTEIAALDSAQALKEYEDKLKLINAAVAQQPQLWAAGQQAMEDAARAYQEQVDKMLESTHNFVDGAKGAFDEWATHAMDAGAHAKDIATGFMNTLQKGITDGLTTGKTGFAKMFVDLKKQIVGAEVEQFFTGPIAQGLGSVIPALKPKGTPKTLGVDIGTEQNPLIVAIRGGGAGKVASGGPGTGGATSAGGTTMSGETILAGSAKGGGGAAGGGGGLLFGGAGGSGQTVGSAAMQVAGNTPTSGKGWENLLLGKGNVSPMTRLITWSLGPHGDNKAAPGPLPLTMLPQLEGPSHGITPPQLLPMTAPSLPEPVWPGAGWSTGGGGGGAGFNPVTDELAEGGPVRAGRAYLVGEKGREIFVPREDGQVVSNGKMMGLGFAMGGTMDEKGGKLGSTFEARPISPTGTEFASILGFAQGGMIGAGGKGGGGTVISPAASGTSVSPSGVDTTVAGSGMLTGSDNVTYLNDTVTKKLRYALFNWQQTAAGGYATPTGMMKETGAPYHRNWWLTDFLPTAFMLFSNFVNAYRGIVAGGGGSTGQMFMEAFKGVLGMQQQAGGSGSVGSVGGVSDPGLGTPSYMPGGAPIAAPDITTMNLPQPTMPDLGGFTPVMPTLAHAAGGVMTPSGDMALPPSGGLLGSGTPGLALALSKFLLGAAAKHAGHTGVQLEGGGIMTPYGTVPLRTYDEGGIATRPMAAIFGEGSMHEAFVPLPDGRRIPVALESRDGGGGFAPREGGVYRTEVHVHGVQDVDSFRRSRGQIMAEVSNAQRTHARSNR